ncbi:HDOD domain-containing protein [Actomonas aquatica]|uniref:HDOD domain-containing protein n=1 Tax=Actomonas aquatica TaxID=2866162 RepID=A0ABZ1C2K4_9BACT|nr:HDOD domain-containing protein [Opitutus sp. WL0086]WRQ85567.1 HDOD domain-containing protein [Opitutus sp. WL0086]
MAAAAKRLPSSPRVFGALEAALRNPDVAIDSVVEVVRVDPSLAVRVIRVANSPVFRRGDAVESLDMAISRIGLREIHRLVGAAVADQLFAVGLPLYRISGDALWLNALVTALAAEQMATACGRDPREAYTLGLLRSAGRMLLQRIGQEAALPPTSGAKANGAETRAWELATFGMSADEAGAQLLELWDFAPTTVNGLRYAWSPTQDARRQLEPALLHLACWGCDALEQGLPIERDFWTTDEAVLKQAGLDKERVDATIFPTREAVNRTLDMLKPGERV